MSRLNKELSLLQGVGMLTTSLLGTGIFIVPAAAAALADADSLWAWVVLTVLALPVAFTFASLGQRYPHAGGAPALIGRAFGVSMERSVAFLFLAVIPVGLPAALMMTTGFWHAIFDLSPGMDLAMQLATLALMLILGQRPARASGQVQVAIAVMIVLTVASFWWLGGLPGGRPVQPAVSTVDWSAVTAALTLMFWCFVGLEAFTHLGEEFRNPQRDFPLALMLGVVLAGLVYWACSVAVVSFGIFGDAEANRASLPNLVGLLWGEQWQWVAALIGYLACFASINIYLQGFGRLLWSLADEGKLPASLAVLNRHGVPARAFNLVVLICAVCALIAAWRGTDIDTLMRYANGNFVLVYLLSMITGCVLLRGGARLIALIASICCALVLLWLGTQTFYALTVLLAFWIIDHLGGRRAIAARRKQSA
ncbi:L-methionine/branched-chain amino acid transporter [Marinobacterium litorale]|uniref:L-methionine/branched-chain amino acid transporter n=1 Tax=Marinobacterium litorale TaxID=404770 RepID=UPI0004194F77|nr:L-methionine/branched-chain amino acid transporter [Marinobacterium litorale]